MRPRTAVAMPRRIAVLGVFTFVILAFAIVNATTGSWYWAVATELLIMMWFAVTHVIQRRRHRPVTAPRP